MIKKLSHWWARTGPWVKAMRFYRNSEFDKFFEMLQILEELDPLTPYQLGVKGNALLLSGQYKEALSIFSMLSSLSDHGNNNAKYIGAYSRAMIADINGNTDEYDRIARAASLIPVKSILRRNLPLPRYTGANSA